MEPSVISEKRFSNVVETLLEHGAVFGPRRMANGQVALVRLALGDVLDFSHGNAVLPLKALFFPQREPLLVFENGETREAPLPDERVTVLGARPCDVAALGDLDEIFLQTEPVDPYYQRRRQLTTIVSFACTSPLSTCFCTSFGAGPGAAHGADVLATNLGGEILLVACTAKGEESISRVEHSLGHADQAQIDAAEATTRTAAERMTRLDLDGIDAALGDRFDDPLWAELGEVCIACGTCSYLCPTCHCFDITDEVKNGNGVRVRTWDCCAYPLFTAHASGHNPRPTQMERWRQRMMHKFRYAVQNHGRFFCVGCGRCIRGCPVNLDLRIALERTRG